MADGTEWIPANTALERVAAAYGTDSAKRWLLERLKSGKITATSKWSNQTGGDVEDGEGSLIVPDLWRTWYDLGCDYFWKTSDALFVLNPHLGARQQRIEIWHHGVMVEATDFPGAMTGAYAEQDTAPARKPLPAAEYINASRAIVAGWSTDITEERAVEMAKAMFPSHQVARDPFLAQYRVIRGPKKRGKQPLRDK